MSELKKATLQEIKSDASGSPLGEEIEVQFNPTTLKLQLSNKNEGGKSRGRQARQYLGSSSTTLTLDLVFDTADEGTTEKPRNVREKTALVEKFVLPKGEGKAKQAPPKLRFHWGTLILDGIVDSISIDFDLFAADGAPLRAKIGLTIKEQNSKYQYLKAGPGGNQDGSAPEPGQAGAGAPGSSGGPADRSAPAIGGESAGEFASRMGLDPAAWRGLSVGLNSSLSLGAGMEIGFSAGLSVSAGIGVSVGFEVGVNASLEASFGLEASASINAVTGVGTGANLASGFALSAAGGVGAAIETVSIARTQAAEEKTRQAFAAAPANVSVTSQASMSASQRPSLPEQRRTPLAATGLPSPAAQQSAPPAPAPPRADPRATSFGYGVPLRQTVGQAANLRAGALQGRVAVHPRIAASGAPAETRNPTTPPWVALPSADRAPAVADRAQKRRSRPGRPCSCVRPCRCKRR